MAYSSSSGKLPVESASKLGHLNVIESEWVKELINSFESKIDENEYKNAQGIWNTFNSKNIRPLKHLWVADGSYVPLEDKGREVAFVKTALMTIDKNKIEKINKEYPHPLHMQEVMKDSALFHATVFPLKNIVTKNGSIYDTVRNAIYDSIKIDQDGLYFETLKWLAYEKWNDSKRHSPKFECPHCGETLENGLSYDLDKGFCTFENCEREILLTDMIGFHLDMNEENAPVAIASSYMLIMEMLMLFTVIRLHWNHSDKSLVTETLYIKDGPMMLGSQYSKLVPLIRNFLEYAKKIGRPIHIVSSEKSGKYFDYLNTINKYVNVEGDNIKYAVLSHEFIRNEIQRAPDHVNPYGSRTNWGEKIFVKMDSTYSFILNIPTGSYCKEPKFPQKEDIIGLERILATIPALISRKYEGALYPIELVNAIASMSNYPSAKILKEYIRDTLK